jgi:hypothetical protein
LAISPPSDIVLDVARAAGPADLAAAREALTRKAGGTAVPFAVGEPAPSRAAADADAPDVNAANKYQRFEAMVLQTFIQNMLPKDAEGVYGKGLAGDMWKSQLSERLADVIAERGGIGIARKMLADHYMEGKRTVPVGPVSGGPERAGIDRQASLSASLVQQVERRVVRSLDDDAAMIATAGRVGS